jgi:hypothetical protein
MITARLVLLASLLLVAAAPATASTRVRTEPAPDLQLGEADGVAVTTRGRLLLAPRLARLGSPAGLQGQAHIWSAVVDGTGQLFLGTGPEGRILRVPPSGPATVFHTVPEPMVTALAFLPGGELLAGTAPAGRIYRIQSDGRAELWCETGERYVWALAPRGDGTVFAGTGEQGLLLRIDRNGRASPWFDSVEAHLVSLFPLPDGSVLAGGAGRGLVYRVVGEGQALVLHDDELPEVTGVVQEADGSVVATLLAPPEPESRPPAVRIQLPEGATMGAAPEAAGELEDRPGATIQGVIEGLAPVAEERPKKLRGRVVRIGADGTVRELWRSTAEAPFALALDASGSAVFGTGEPARLWKVDGDDEVTLVATLREAQVTSLVRNGGFLVAATSNPAAAYRLDRASADEGMFTSRPFDAGGAARWGTIRWRIEGTPGRIELYTRTGNSADPDLTWSAWSPALTNAEGSPVINPEGRFLQWRARLVGSGTAGSRVAGVTVTYALINRPPEATGFRLEPPTAKPPDNARLVFRFRASDPDGDPLEARLEVRRTGEASWSVAVREPLPPGTVGHARERSAGIPPSSRRVATRSAWWSRINQPTRRARGGRSVSSSGGW